YIFVVSPKLCIQKPLPHKSLKDDVYLLLQDVFRGVGGSKIFVLENNIVVISKEKVYCHVSSLLFRWGWNRIWCCCNERNTIICIIVCVCKCANTIGNNISPCDNNIHT